MRQGDQYYLDRCEIDIPRPANWEMEPAGMADKTKSTPTVRNNMIHWIDDEPTKNYFLSLAQTVNEKAGWHFDIDKIENLQYTVYTGGQQYGWHADQHKKPYPDGRMRKMSFSLLLSEGFEGGHFDIDTRHAGYDVRHDTLDLKIYDILWFKSAYYHRVNPVTSGERISLVGWVLGKGC